MVSFIFQAYWTAKLTTLWTCLALVLQRLKILHGPTMRYSIVNKLFCFFTFITLSCCFIFVHYISVSNLIHLCLYFFYNFTLIYIINYVDVINGFHAVFPGIFNQSVVIWVSHEEASWYKSSYIQWELQRLHHGTIGCKYSNRLSLLSLYL